MEPARPRAEEAGAFRRRRSAIGFGIAAVASFLAACGGEAPAPPSPPPIPKASGVAGPPPAPPIPEAATAAQVSDLVRDALDDEGDLRAAVPALRRIVSAHDGWATDARGDLVWVDVLAGAVAARAAERARASVEGTAPDAARARALLDLGTEALAAAEAPDAPEAAELARARAWVELAGPPFRADRVGWAPTSETPVAFVLVVTDDFELGETLLASVLRRWAKGAPVQVVARLTGHVRAGMRREPADDASERASLRKRIGEVGGVAAGMLLPDDPRIAASGLGPGTSIFVVGPSGTLLARCAGRTLDPRSIDDAVRAAFPGVPAAPK